MTTASINELYKRLAMHAGFPRSDDTVDDLSVFLWQWTQGGTDVLNVGSLRVHVTEIIEILHRINAETEIANVPRGSGQRIIPEELTYAMSGIIRLLLDACIVERKRDLCPDNLTALVAAAQNIATCWDSLVAGDIEDIMSNLTTSNSIREFPLTCNFPSKG